MPDTLRLTGDNVQVSPGTPIGLGDINLRVAGDLYLYKDPGQPIYVTGSFDSISGTYAFQGRRFDVIPASSINFRGDSEPRDLRHRDARHLRRRDAREHLRPAAGSRSCGWPASNT